MWRTVRRCNCVHAGAVEVAHLKGEVTLDKWLRFSVAAQHAVMICAMRDKLMVCCSLRVFACEFIDDAAAVRA